jgi:hypothetical protein
MLECNFETIGMLVPISLLIWRMERDHTERKTLQGMLVLFCALVASNAYQSSRLAGTQTTHTDQIWIVLPLLTSFAVTGRCFVTRYLVVIVRMLRHFLISNKGA